ncbi:MAG: TetR/AcrR family transcriptional regulator [Clostridia bacterium]|nr:TetR/AcrR family transcriptional regulator [Clostridia bacterium]
MDFDRVRNAEQRKIRFEQIKNAAIKLFDEKQFHEITLANISKETSFTRGNLYKYISSKEEIYLLVIVDEIRDWIKDLNKHITSDMTNDIESFSIKWATITYQHQRFLKLISILFTILERNVSLERLIEFKNEFAIETSRAFDSIRTAFPAWDNKKIRRFIDIQKHFAIGLYPTTTPAPIQREALEKSNMDFQFPDFIKEFSELIRFTIVYLNHDVDN